MTPPAPVTAWFQKRKYDGNMSRVKNSASAVRLCVSRMLIYSLSCAKLAE